MGKEVILQQQYTENQLVWYDIYLNWISFPPTTWKRGTLKSLVEWAYVICSRDQLLERELKYLEKLFQES